ncbi:DUF602-domain-containing protein [Clavulina sp. PMI_390]|nr:DUF602-domain-containing protein [Clavulina sp. PMI_390]
MGNDGGSIPDRRDLVKTKAKAEQADKNNQTIAAWFYCALSKKDLEEPIVSCELGKLYIKDAILEYLVDKSAYGDGERICGHIRTIKDVKTLKFTPNPSKRTETDADLGRRHARFICPLTLREMSGQTPFVYITTCGDVFSAAGLKTLSTSDSSSSSSTPPSSEGEASPSTARDICPQCGEKFDKVNDVRPINPTGEQALKLRDAMLASRAAAKAAKASKKRKAEDSAAASGADSSKAAKKGKKSKADDAEGASALPAPSTNAAFAGVNKKVAQELAEEEKRRKSSMSSAVASLYQKKDAKPAKETFLTMNTFTRYA